MLVAGLIGLLLNTTWLLNPVTQIPALQMMTGAGDAALYKAPAPPCSLVGGPAEGWLRANATQVDLLCRDSPTETAATAPWQLVRATYDVAEETWTSRVLGPGIGAPLRWTADAAGNHWVLVAGSGPASGGGTAGNGGAPGFYYYDAAAAAQPPDPLKPIPLLLYNATNATIVDFVLNDFGFYVLARITSGGIGTSLMTSAVAAWGVDTMPRQPFTQFPWMLGTQVPRMMAAFLPPSAAQPRSMVMATTVYPPVVEVWAKNTSGARNWFVEGTVTLRLPGYQPIASILPFSQPGSFLVQTRKTISTFQPAVPAPLESMVASIGPGSPMIFQAVAQTQWQLSPSVTPTSSAPATQSRTSSASASVSVSASASVASSPTATGSPSATSTASSQFSQTPLSSPLIPRSYTATATAAPLSTSSASASAQPSASALPTLQPGETRSNTGTVTPTGTPTPTQTNGTAPLPPPAANAITESPSAQLGLGFGLTALFIGLTGIFFGFFARQTAFKIIYWIRTHIMGQSAPKGKGPRHPTRSNSARATATRLAADPGVIQLNLNPAMVQQQTAMDLLQLARQQRLEAIQAQQRELVTENPSSMNRLKSFKQVYKPIRAPGTSV